MPRTALHTDDIKIEQKPDITDTSEYDGDIVVAQNVMPDKDYLDQLKFNEEPVTIRLEPSSERNAATMFPVWVNGKGAEVFRNGQWHELAYLPVGQVIITKRKYLAVIVGAKTDRLTTEDTEPEDIRPENRNNTIRRSTSAVHALSVIEDKNPLGAAWLTELYRRNS